MRQRRESTEDLQFEMNSVPQPSSRVIRSRIPSDYEILTEYHRHHPWIPGSNQIRPSPELKAIKEDTLREIDQKYRSTTDFILSTVFQFPTIMDRAHNKLFVDGVSDEEADATWSEETLNRLFVSNPSIKPLQFVPNSFPYQLTGGGHHYVMWYSSSRLLKGDDEISHTISRGIKKVLKDAGSSDQDFDFAWYVNPKMTVPQLAHVQVFWVANAALSRENCASVSPEPRASVDEAPSTASMLGCLPSEAPRPARSRPPASFLAASSSTTSSTPPRLNPREAAAAAAEARALRLQQRQQPQQPPSTSSVLGCIQGEAEGEEALEAAEAAMLAEAIRLSLEGAQAAKGPGWLPI